MAKKLFQCANLYEAVDLLNQREMPSSGMIVWPDVEDEIRTIYRLRDEELEHHMDTGVADELTVNCISLIIGHHTGRGYPLEPIAQQTYEVARRSSRN